MSEVVDISCSIGSNQVQSSFLDDDANSQSRELIGAMVRKEFGYRTYTGEVVSYCGETKLFKIEYGNYATEELDYEELQKIVDTCPYLEPINPSEMEEKKKKKKRVEQEDTWFPIHPRYYSSTYQKPVRPRRKKGKSEGSSSAYIPLAFRETKKDAYYYY